MARALWFQGYAEQTIDQARLSLEEAQRTNFPLSIGEALRVAVCDIALMTGDLGTADQSITMLLDIATSRNAPFWGILGRCLRGKLLVIRGEFAQGSALLRTELEFCERAGWPIWYPEFMGAMAEGLAELGQVAEARAAVDRGWRVPTVGESAPTIPNCCASKVSCCFGRRLVGLGPARRRAFRPHSAWPGDRGLSPWSCALR